MTLDEKLQNAAAQARTLVRDLEAPPLAPSRSQWVTPFVAAALLVLGLVVANWMLLSSRSDVATTPTDPPAPTPVVTESPERGETAVPSEIYAPEDPADIDVCALLSEASDRSGAEADAFGGFREDRGFRVCPGTAADRLDDDPRPPAAVEGWEELQLGLLPTATSLEQARRILDTLDLGDGTMEWETLPPLQSSDGILWFSEADGYFVVAVSVDPHFFFVTAGDPGQVIAVSEAAISVLEGIDVCGLLRAAIAEAGMARENVSGDSESAGFERCSSNQDKSGVGFGNLNLGLMETVNAEGQARLILEELFSAGDPSEWTVTADGLWVAEHSDPLSTNYHVVAAWKEPYLFFVTDDDPDRAMAVAQGVIGVLEAADPNAS
jgi:hypothetical protein